MLLDILEDVFQHKHTMLKTVKRDDDDDCIDPASGVFGTDSGIPRSGDSMHFSCREQVGNPMLDLFYGSSVNVDANSGKNWHRTSLPRCNRAFSLCYFVVVLSLHV